MKINFQSQKGIGLIEILVGLGVISIAFLGFLRLAQYSLKIQEQNKGKLEAINIAAETLEVVRNLRDEDWDDFAILSLETQYYPVIPETLTAVDPGPINGIYSRWVILGRVFRDTNDNIAPSGAEDDQVRKVTAFVEWNDHGDTRQISLTTYLSNW